MVYPRAPRRAVTRRRVLLLVWALAALSWPSGAIAATTNGMIVFALQNGASRLYTMNVDGSGLHLIYRASDGTYVREPEWSPDGNEIAFTEYDDAHGNRIMRYDGRTGSVTPVTDHPRVTTAPNGDP